MEVQINSKFKLFNSSECYFTFGEVFSHGFGVFNHPFRESSGKSAFPPTPTPSDM